MNVSNQLRFQGAVFEAGPVVAITSRHTRRRGHGSEHQLALPGIMVAEFHRSFGLPISSAPTLDVPLDLLEFRHNLLIEELREFVDAIDAEDVVAVADALGDMVYVLYGTAATFGINLDAVVVAIHKSNMSKLGSDGQPVMRPDGKVLKGPNYHPPAIHELLGTERSSR